MFGKTTEDIARIDEVRARLGCLKGLLNLLSDTVEYDNGLDWLLLDAIKKVGEIGDLVDKKELEAR